MRNGLLFLPAFAVLACGGTRTFELPAEGAAPALALDAPAGCTAETRSGPDFVVHHLACPEGRIGLVVGPRPGPARPESAEAIDGRVLGRAIRWSAWTEEPEGGPRHHREVVIDDAFEPPARALHAFAFGASRGEADRLVAAVETLRRR